MKVTYRGLQKELRKRNISTKGSKAELSDRLQKAIATCGTSIVPGVLAPDAAAIERCGTGAKAAVAVSTSPVVSAPLTVPVSVLTHQERARLLSYEPRDAVVFGRDPSLDSLVSDLVITNRDATRCVMYKVKTKWSDRFVVKPHVALLRPGESVTVHFYVVQREIAAFIAAMNTQRARGKPESVFLLQECPLPDDAAVEPGAVPPALVQALWKAQEAAAAAAGVALEYKRLPTLLPGDREYFAELERALREGPHPGSISPAVKRRFGDIAGQMPAIDVYRHRDCGFALPLQPVHSPRP